MLILLTRTNIIFNTWDLTSKSCGWYVVCTMSATGVPPEFSWFQFGYIFRVIQSYSELFRSKTGSLWQSLEFAVENRLFCWGYRSSMAHFPSQTRGVLTGGVQPPGPPASPLAQNVGRRSPRIGHLLQTPAPKQGASSVRAQSDTRECDRNWQ